MSNYMQAVNNGVLGAAMASGPGHARREGVLGEAMASGPGHARDQGILGSVLQAGAGRAWQNGSLGATSGTLYGMWASLSRKGALVDEPQSFFTFTELSAPGSTDKLVIRVNGVPADLKRGDAVRQKFFSNKRVAFAEKTPYVLEQISFMFDVASARSGGTKATTFYHLNRMSPLTGAKWPTGLGSSPTFGVLTSTRNPTLRNLPTFTSLPWSALGSLGAAPLTVSAEMIGFACIGFAAIVLWDKHQKGQL